MHGLSTTVVKIVRETIKIAQTRYQVHSISTELNATRMNFAKKKVRPNLVRLTYPCLETNYTGRNIGDRPGDSFLRYFSAVGRSMSYLRERKDEARPRLVSRSGEVHRDVQRK